MLPELCKRAFLGPILVKKVKYTGLRARTKKNNAFKFFGSTREKSLLPKNTKKCVWKYKLCVKCAILRGRTFSVKSKKRPAQLVFTSKVPAQGQNINTSPLEAMTENCLLPEKA